MIVKNCYNIYIIIIAMVIADNRTHRLQPYIFIYKKKKNESFGLKINK